MRRLSSDRISRYKSWLHEATSWFFVIAVVAIVGGILVTSHASATTSGRMVLYFHKEASDASENYNALSLTPPEPAADTAPPTTTSVNTVTATPPTAFCQAADGATDANNERIASAASTGNRCLSTFISMPIGNAISMSTSDTNAITSQLWSSESATQAAVALNVYLYRCTTTCISSNALTSTDRIATLTCAEPGTAATSCSVTATPANNITFAATDRIVAVVTSNVTTLRSGASTAFYFDSSGRTATSVTLNYTALGYNTSNKPSLTGSRDEDFANGGFSSTCSTSGTVYDSAFTCLQGSAASTSGSFKSDSSESSSWFRLSNQTTATTATTSDFGTTPSNTFFYETMPGAYGNGNIRTVLNSTATFGVGATNATSPFNHVGLVLWTSNTDFLELQVYSTGATTGTNSVVVALNNSGTLGTTTSLNPSTTSGIFGEVWLGFSNTGGSWQAQYSTDGTTWNNVGSAVSHTTRFTRTGLNAFTKIANPVSTYSGDFEWFSYGLADPTYNQTSYRFFDNTDNANPTNSFNNGATAQNTPIALTAAGQQFRLRQLIKGTGQIFQNGAGLFLQYAPLGGSASCSAISSSNYKPLDVGASWQEVGSTTSVPSRTGYQTLEFNNKLWVLGGFSGTSTWLNDVWSSSDGISWSQVTSNAGWPGRQNFAVAVYNSKMWVMGGVKSNGSGGSTVINDVWSSPDGATWTQATSAAGWSTRINPSSISFNNKLWLLGGSDNNNIVQHDVWSTTDGTTWTQATSAAGWGARQLFGVAVFNSKLWVAGGSGASAFNDVWSSTDGASWSQATSNAGFPTGQMASMAVFNSKLWFIGLESTNNTEVWSSSDGATWVKLTSSGGWTSSQAYFWVWPHNSSLYALGNGPVNIDVWDISSPALTYYDNPTPADDTNISPIGNDPTDTGQTVAAQTYQESGGFSNSQSDIGGTVDGEWDFSLIDNGAPAGTSYCFRVVKSDGSSLDTYTNYPMITTYTPGPTVDQVMRGGKWFNSGVKQSYFWAQ